jgi:hypothetical protein
MGSINTLCQRTVYLENGRVKRIGPTREIVPEYLSNALDISVGSVDRLRLPGQGEKVRLADVRLEPSNGSTLVFGEPLTYVLDIRADAEVDDMSIGSGIWDSSGACVGSLITKETFTMVRGEKVTLRLVIPNLSLAPGIYHAGFSIVQGGRDSLLHFLDVVIGVPFFQIVPNAKDHNMVVENWQSNWGSIVISEAELEVKK